MKPRIVVPYDFSETADAALAWAADFCRSTGAPAIHMVHAIPRHLVGADGIAFEMLEPGPRAAWPSAWFDTPTVRS